MEVNLNFLNLKYQNFIYYFLYFISLINIILNFHYLDNNLALFKNIEEVFNPSSSKYFLNLITFFYDILLISKKRRHKIFHF